MISDNPTATFCHLVKDKSIASSTTCRYYEFLDESTGWASCDDASVTGECAELDVSFLNITTTRGKNGKDEVTVIQQCLSIDLMGLAFGSTSAIVRCVGTVEDNNNFVAADDGRKRRRKLEEEYDKSLYEPQVLLGSLYDPSEYTTIDAAFEASTIILDATFAFIEWDVNLHDDQSVTPEHKFYVFEGTAVKLSSNMPGGQFSIMLRPKSFVVKKIYTYYLSLYERIDEIGGLMGAAELALALLAVCLYLASNLIAKFRGDDRGSVEPVM